MSSGWLTRRWYLIQMSYGKFIMSSGWHTLPCCHPDDLTEVGISSRWVTAMSSGWHVRPPIGVHPDRGQVPRGSSLDLRWGLLSQFSPFRYFPNFSEWWKQWLPEWYQVHIWQVSPQLSSSWAVETPGKYEHDWKCLTYTFAKSKFLVTEKLTNGALVTPTPGYTGYTTRNAAWKH